MLSVLKKKFYVDVLVNIYKFKILFMGMVMENYFLLKDGVIGCVQYIIFDLVGGDLQFKYIEGQSIGIIFEGEDVNGKFYKLCFYFIVSICYGDNLEGKIVFFCVCQFEYKNDVGEQIYGVCFIYFCDIEFGIKVKIIGFVGKEMFFFDDEEVNIIMFVIGIGIVLMCIYLCCMFEFCEQEVNGWKFCGKVWLFMGVFKIVNLFYDEDFFYYEKEYFDNFCYIKVIS